MFKLLSNKKDHSDRPVKPIFGLVNRGPLYWLTGLFFALWFIPLKQVAFAENKQETARSVWSKLLPGLNSDPQIQPGVHVPYTAEQEADLHALYENEVSQITKAMPPAQKSKVPLALNEGIASQNLFFHTKVTELNHKSLQILEVASKKSPSKDLDFKETAQKVLTQVQNNPVASLASLERYDGTTQIGFCFGRALLVHQLLQMAGVEQQHIAKIFVLGQLRYQKQHWNFHVAVMLRDAKVGFLVVDPLFGEPLSYKDWLEKVLRFDIKGKNSRARFYVTKPSKFLPSFKDYSLAQLEDKHLVGFFDDLAKTLKFKKK